MLEKRKMKHLIFENSNFCCLSSFSNRLIMNKLLKVHFLEKLEISFTKFSYEPSYTRNFHDLHMSELNYETANGYFENVKPKFERHTIFILIKTTKVLI